MATKGTKRREKINLTARTVKALPPGQYKGTRYYDEKLHGFCVTCYDNGTKVFWLRVWRKAVEKYAWTKLGMLGPLTVEKARAEAERILSKQALGQNPLEEKASRDAAVTFEEWAEGYTEAVKEWKKRPEEDARYLPIASATFGKKLMCDVTVGDIEAVKQSIKKERGKTTANRWLASVRACFTNAWENDKVKDNPAKKVHLFPENPARRRTLTDEELVAVLDRLESEADPYTRAGVKLLIETGARESELLHAKWEDISLQDKLWTLPETKSGGPQAVPLTDSTVALLKKLPHHGAYVLPGRWPDKPRTRAGFYRKVRDIFKDAGVKGVTVHDLRRTFGLAVTRSAGLHVASKLLRHSDIRVTERVYAPLAVDDLRKASEKVNAERGKVVEFAKSKKG